ncbi:LOW QUALITY PROTEIN: hypothetical protein HID58_090531, partial [Brassica napus]
SSSSRQIVNLHNNTRRLRSQLLRFALEFFIEPLRLHRTMIYHRSMFSPSVAVPSYLLHEGIKFCCDLHISSTRLDSAAASRYVSPIFSLSYEIIRRVATLDAMEKRLAISTVIASAAASGGAIVVKEFIGRFEKPRKKKFLDAMKRWGLVPKGKTIFLMVDVEENVAKSSRNIGMLRKLTSLNVFDVLNSNKLVLTLAVVEFLNARYGVEALVTGDEDENVMKFTT